MSTKPERKTLHPALQYATDVAAGRIVASKWVKLAAERHLRDLQCGHDRGLYFDPAAAQHAIDFFMFLCHSKGEWAGKSFVLSDWQQFIVYSLFGWKHSDGRRRFRTAHVEVARKNGKTTLWAGVGLYLFFADGEPGAEVYCAATKKDQARILFTEAERMRKASPGLSKRIVSFRNNMNVPATNSKFEPLGSDEDTLDGLNIHGALVDELHAHKTRLLWDVLDTATGARRQALIAAITTAGYDRQSVCWKQHEYGEKVLEGVINDDSFFIYVASLDPGDDWEDETNWPKANPNLGSSVKLEDLRTQAHKAKNDPSALNSFLRLRLNVWTQQDTRWMPMDKWNDCAGFDLAPANDAKALREEIEQRLAGRTCFAGLDLSSKIDITAFVAIFPPVDEDPRWIVLPTFWLPEDNVDQRVREGRVPYDVWRREGFLNATPGNVVDYDVIREFITRFHDRFDLREVAFDPWNATQIATQLAAAGITMVEFRQGFASMSEPTKQLMALVLSKTLAHLGNPLLRWMASNLVVKQDAAGNIKADKEKSSEKIDGIIATVMALGRAIATADGGNAYDDGREILVV